MREPAPDLALPRGFRDILPTEARELHAIERTLMDSFASYGYVPLEPPTVESATAAVTLDERRVLRFLDRDGRLLALRPDITTAIARVIAQRYAAETRPLRLSYFTPVFREEASMRGSEREYDQAGVEFIGAGGAIADAEVIGLLSAALSACGLGGAQINVGHAGYLRGFLEELPVQARERVGEALRTGDFVEAIKIAREDGMSAASVAAMERGLRHLGEDVTALGADAPAGSAAALNELEQLRPLLDAAGVSLKINFDLGLVPALPYYSGIVFQAIAPDLGFAVAAGGRYDGLLGRFGTDRAATGFGIAVPHLHQAMVAAGWTITEGDPLVVLEPSIDPERTLRAAAQLRAAGRNVVIGESAETAGQAVVHGKVGDKGRVELS